MTTLLDTKSVTRRLLITDGRGKTLIARMSPEGVYIKRDHSRWSNALFLPWKSVFDYGAIRYANEQKRLKKERRQQKNLGRS